MQDLNGKSKSWYERKLVQWYTAAKPIKFLITAQMKEDSVFFKKSFLKVYRLFKLVFLKCLSFFVSKIQHLFQNRGANQNPKDLVERRHILG